MSLMSRLARTGAQTQIRHVAPVPFTTAPPDVRAVYEQVERDFGMLAPPVALHAPAPAVLAACWAVLRETLVVPGAAGRAAKEAIAAGVSLGNTCPYCVQIHASLLYGLLPGPDAGAIAAGRLDRVADPRTRALAVWARSGILPQTVPFAPEALAEHLGVAVAFHYLNRIVNVFLAEPPVPAAAPDWAAEWMMRLIGRMTRPVLRRNPAPGAAVALLPAAPLPDDLAWASGNAVLAEAFSRAAAAVDAEAARSVAAPVRALLAADLAAWDGCPPGPSRAWAQEAAAAIPEAHRPAARLALLTAKASYQVLPADVAAVTATDRELIALTSWAALSAARRIGALIATAASAEMRLSISAETMRKPAVDPDVARRRDLRPRRDEK